MSAGKSILYLSFLIFVTLSALLARPRAASGAGFTPQFRPSLEAAPVRGEIRIDGELDDDGWRGAARAEGFAEVSPGDQIRPPVESAVWVAYDEQNLYVALIAFDDPTAVRVALRSRDEIFNDDYFGIMLDTYGDHAWGYEFFVNPLGIQGDLRMLGDGSEDIAFDLVWHSMGKLTEDGYQVEIAIPFASLRFPDGEEQVWRINFWRDHQRDLRRRYAWAATDRDNPCFMCNWGTLTGIRGIRPGSQFDVIASLVGQQHGQLRSLDDPSSGFSNDDPEGEASVNLRYSLGTNAAAEVTINPDFSQIESDAGQIDVNEPFALFYEERRPFFQDGSDLYNTWISTVYTRSINNPDGAGKLTARFGRLAMAYTFARDDNSPILIPTEERTYLLAGDNSISNILRLKQTFGENSYVGLLATDRRLDGGGAGTVLSADASVRFLRNYRFEFQYAAGRTEEDDDSLLSQGLEDIRLGSTSHTAALDGETYWGHALYSSLEAGARHWSFDLDYWEYSPEFRTDNGFTTRNDYKQVSFSSNLNFAPNARVVAAWSPGLGLGRIWDSDNRFQDEWLRPSLYIELPLQTSIYSNYMWSRERFRGEIFDGIHAGYLEVNGRLSGQFGYNLSGRAGRLIWRTFHDTPVLGKSLNLTASLDLRPTQRLRIAPRIAYTEMRRPETNSEIYSGCLLRTRVDYQFSRQAFIRVVAEYDNFDQSLSVEPLFTYRVNAFTVFYAGMASNYADHEAPVLEDGTGQEPFDEGWNLNRRQIFAKFQYLLRI